MVRGRGARFVEAPFTGSKRGRGKGSNLFITRAAKKRRLTRCGHYSRQAAKQLWISARSARPALSKSEPHAHGSECASRSRSDGYRALFRYSAGEIRRRAQAKFQQFGTLDLKVPRIMASDFEPHFSVKHMLKDMQIAKRIARHFDLDLTVAGATRDRLLDEAGQGRGDDDYSSIARRFLPFVHTPDLEEQ